MALPRGTMAGLTGVPIGKVVQVTLPIVNAIWIGPRLGEVHVACLRSFLRFRHDVRLYCYDDISDVPAGVEVMDANVLMPREALIRYPDGSFAISANLMRYRMMSLGLGLYVDCDVFCLSPIEDGDYLIGFESNKEINNAVLKLPASSPVVADLMKIKEGWCPPWVDPAKRKPLAEYAWGTTGPRALTHYLRKYNATRHAKPIDVFYPVHHQQTALFSDPSLRLSDLISWRTRFVHLYNASASGQYVDSPPKGSPLWQLMELSES